MKIQARLIKNSGGFSGQTHYRLQLYFDVSESGYEQEKLLEQAKSNAKEILKKLGSDINVDEIWIQENDTL